MILLLIVILAVLALVMAYLVFLLVTSAIVFARAAFALAAALVIQQSTSILLVPGNGFLNYVAWAVICLGVVFLLSGLPQVDLALRFACTTIISVLLVFIVVFLFGGLFSSIAGETFVLNAFFEILVKAICLGLAIWAMLSQNKKAYDAPKNLLLRIVERVLASVLFGFAILFLCSSISSNWPMPDLAALLIFGGSTVVVFFILPRIQNKLFATAVEPAEFSMPQ